MENNILTHRPQGSFRDPSGFIFFNNGVLHRQVNNIYRENFDHLVKSGLYDSLTRDGLLVRHEEAEIGISVNRDAYKIIKPEIIPFISYPYEWSFSQLKDAALLTLKIQKKAIDSGMTLKDASAYNIQFKGGKPVLIDTLSFEKYEEGNPWVAYRQFCQHFLAPLALASYTDIRLQQLLRIHIDGIPLDLTSALLPSRTNFKFGILSHIHLHAKSQKYFSSNRDDIKKRYAMSRHKLMALIDSLESTVKNLHWKFTDTEWGDYYDKTNYPTGGLEEKNKIVSGLLDELNPKIVWDLGANNGLFSRTSASKNIFTVSLDIDPVAIESNYDQVVKQKEKNILPLIMDLFNPTPSLGWGLKERMSLVERGPADTVLALALIHHLVISNNLPFGVIAEFFSDICNSLIIEFVPKNDSQVKKLLATREDVFSNYNQKDFETEFAKYFDIKKAEKISDSERTLYLMVKNEHKN